MRRGQILALFADELDVGCERERTPGFVPAEPVEEEEGGALD